MDLSGFSQGTEKARVFPRLEIQMWWSRDHGSLHFSNNMRLVAVDRNGGCHTEGRLVTALLIKQATACSFAEVSKDSEVRRPK
jgi:hypothetical protein